MTADHKPLTDQERKDAMALIVNGAGFVEPYRTNELVNAARTLLPRYEATVAALEAKLAKYPLERQELLPCPFCGGLPRRHWESPRASFIICDECRSSGSVFKTMNEAIAAWNRREK